MSNIKVDKDMPIPEPPKKDKGGRKEKYPWSQMDIGDSFLFPASTKTNTAYTAARTAGLKFTPNRTFIMRQIGDRFRCWRVK
jgi:hypothetical protein